MATQHVERNLLLNLHREENISLACFFLPLKRERNVRHLQPPFSTWRLLAFPPVTLSLLYQHVRWMQLCGSLSILWHCLSLALEWKLIFSSPVATAEFSRFADMLNAALSQHCVLGFEIAQLVGQNIKDTKRGKRIRDGDLSWGGSCVGGEVSMK